MGGVAWCSIGETAAPGMQLLQLLLLLLESQREEERKKFIDPASDRAQEQRQK